MKQILAPYGDSLSINFSDSNNDSQVIIKGSEISVENVAASIQNTVNGWEKRELIVGFSELVSLPKGHFERMASKYSSKAKEFHWIVNAIKVLNSKSLIKFSKEEDFVAEDLGSQNFHHLKFYSTDNSDNGYEIKIVGPKSLVSIAKKMLEEESERLLNIVEVTINIFEHLTEDASCALNKFDNITKSSIIKQLIGKEGKALKEQLEKFNVQVHIFKDDEVDLEGENNNRMGLMKISGSPQNVNGIRNYFSTSVSDMILNSFSSQANIPSSVFPSVLGRGGSRLKELSDKYKVRIEIDKTLTDGTIDFVISGSEQGCEGAHAEILEISSTIVNFY